MNLHDLMERLQPMPRLWTKEEYYQMAAFGWFQGQKVELLEGVIYIQRP